MPEQHTPVAQSETIFLGGSDTLQLEDGGKVYHPGDPLPRLSQARRAALRAAGIRLGTRHHEPVLTPEGTEATIAASDQVPGGAVAAVEPMPAAATAPPDESKPRSASRAVGRE